MRLLDAINGRQNNTHTNVYRMRSFFCNHERRRYGSDFCIEISKEKEEKKTLISRRVSLIWVWTALFATHQ